VLQFSSSGVTRNPEYVAFFNNIHQVKNSLIRYIM